MPTPFAALETRLGASILARLSNATATVLAGGATVDGIFNNRAVEADLGQTGMLARETVFTCAWAEAQDAAIEIGSGLQIAYRGAVTGWQVARITEINDVGHADIVLEAPQP